MGQSFRVLPVATVASVKLDAPGLVRKGMLTLTFSALAFGAPTEVVHFTRQQHPEFSALARALQDSDRTWRDG